MYRRGVRWKPTAGLAAAVVLAAGCGTQAVAAGQAQTVARPGARAGAGHPVITQAAASRVLVRYAASVGQANLARSVQSLAGLEAGSSLQLDAGAYRFSAAADPANRGYQALRISNPVFYIPASRGLRWWAATVSWTQPREPGAPAVPALLLFRQVAGRWRQVLEPDILTSVPGPALAGAGRALAVAPAALAGLTARRLNALPAAGTVCPRPGLCRARPGAGIAVGIPGNLADLRDQAFWASRLPAGAADMDLHYLAGGPVYVTSVRGGGALVFYGLRAVLHLAPPAGSAFSITIPGFFSAAAPRSEADLTYAEQFAAYDPARGNGAPRVVADVAGPVSGRG